MDEGADRGASVTLREKRCLFTALLAKLIEHINASGYECSLNEVMRDKRVAELNAKSGKGIARSNHLVGLAADVNLYNEGVYLERTESHAPFGAWWKQQHPLCRWGGDFNDGNHYSLEHEGIK